MRQCVDATYISNTLSYIHLLPLNGKNEELAKIVYYFNIDSYKNNSSISHYKLLKKVIMLINKDIYGYKYYFIFFITILII